MSEHTPTTEEVRDCYIDLGNEAVQTAEDIANILRETADRVDRVDVGAFKNIRDLNGNTVGLWQVKSI